jgi:hypothetical protein
VDALSECDFSTHSNFSQIIAVTFCKPHSDLDLWCSFAFQKILTWDFGIWRDYSTRISDPWRTVSRDFRLLMGLWHDIRLFYRRELNMAILSSPVTKIMYRFYWRTAIKENKRISSSAPGLGVMTLRKCRVDRPLPVTWLGNGWELPPLHSGQVKGLFNPCFSGLTLRYRNAVAQTCNQLFWFSLIYIFIDDDTIPHCNFKIGA